MEGHANLVESVSMDSACKTAVSGSSDKTVKLWDLGSGRCLETYDHGQAVYDIMMHESGSSFLASGYAPGRLKAWAFGTDKPLLDADLSKLGPSGMRFAASRDLSTVAICYADLKRDVLGVSVWR
jgi:WD40 repeat protein